MVTKETGIDWLRRHAAYDGADCLIWPFSRDSHGYGQGSQRGRSYKAHREMCKVIHGPCPSPDHQASHSCGKGHLGCLHPKHLSWRTRSENHLDRRQHGTHATNNDGHNGKVTVEVAAAVLALKNKLSQAKIAARFSISCPTVRRIFKGKTRAARGRITPIDWSASNRKSAQTRRLNSERALAEAQAENH